MTYQKDRDEAAEKRSKHNCSSGYEHFDKEVQRLLRIGFEDGSDFGKQWEEERVGPVVEALKAWLEWEREQIKKEGSYVGKRINELIQQGESALKAFEEGK